MCLFIVLYTEDDRLWLKHIAEINTTDNILALRLFILLVNENMFARVQILLQY